MRTRRAGLAEQQIVECSAQDLPILKRLVVNAELHLPSSAPSPTVILKGGVCPSPSTAIFSGESLKVTFGSLFGSGPEASL